MTVRVALLNQLNFAQGFEFFFHKNLHNDPLSNTPQPLYNTVHYNMVLAITLISAGPQNLKLILAWLDSQHRNWPGP